MGSKSSKPTLPQRAGVLIKSFDLEVDADTRIKKLVEEKIKLPAVSSIPMSDRAFVTLVTGKLRTLTLQAYDLVAAEEAPQARRPGYTPPLDELRVRVKLVVQPKLPPDIPRASRRPLATIWGDGEVWVKGKRIERARRQF